MQDADHLTQEQADEFAIGALEDDLDRAIRLHLLECEPCRTLVTEAQLVAASLALSAPLEKPPADLRRRVFESAGITRPTLISRLARYGAAAALVASVVIGVAAFTGMVTVRSDVDELRRANEQLNQRLREAASAQIEVVALGEKLEDAERITEQLTAEAQRDKELLIALTSDRSKVVGVRKTDDESPALGRVVWDPDRSRLWFLGDAMPTLPPGEQYQIWLNSGGSYISIGTFNPDSTGFVRFDAPIGQDISNYDVAVVTVEKQDSAPGREGPSVFVLDLAGLR